MGKSRSRFGQSIFFPLRFVILLWIIKLVEIAFSLDFSFLGIFPQTVFGLSGIIFAPLIHGNLMHLISNSVPLLVLGFLLFFFYDRIAPLIFFYCYIVTGVLVWIFARPSLHIGASGLVYGIAFFLLFIGIFRKDFLSVFISLAVAIFYGGIIWGVLPGEPGISWESHLMGAIVGLSCASFFGSKKRVSNS